jgi:carboxyl-terminal processing protease
MGWETRIDGDGPAGRAGDEEGKSLKNGDFERRESNDLMAPEGTAGALSGPADDPLARESQSSSRSYVLAAGLLVALAMSPWLSGCGTDYSPVRRVIGAMGGDGLALSPASKRELARFEEAYREHLPPPDTPASDGDEEAQFQLFRDAFKRVRVSYVREIKDDALIDAAIKGVKEIETGPDGGKVELPKLMETALDSMMASLDPHSAYLTPEELRETQVATTGEFGGLGIQVTMAEGAIKVVSPIDDTPAFHAGLKAGDLITHMDGIPIKGKKLMEAVRHMRGKPGTDIKLTVVRGDDESFEVTLTRAVIKIRSVRWRAEDDIGYIRVVSFTEKVEDGIEKAMEAMHKEMGDNLKGIVLDLRNNPGGLLTQSLALADAFLEDGKIVSVRGRPSTNERVFKAESGDLAAGLPMVVLVNGGSASASEIVAGALQDNGRAIIMGSRSFGKGSVQTITPLPMQAALRLTTALYYAPSGRTIQAHGVDPDIALIGGESAKQKREADLPGAIPSVFVDVGRPQATLTDSECPAIGEAKDRQLGCALEFLHAGSTEKFLAALGLHHSL